MAYTALGAAVLAICAWISVPTTVPFTLQTFGVFCLLSLLGGRRGTLAILVYILLGLIGVPVFSGFRGGAGVLFGTTGGYILGFLLSGLLYRALEGTFRNRENKNAATVFELLTMAAGLLLCYAFGTLWFMAVYSKNTGAIGLGAALSWCVLPFILPDAIKLALGFLLGARLRSVLRL